MGRYQLIAAAILLALCHGTSRAQALPNAVYAEFAMTTAGINIVIASTGTSFGQYVPNPTFTGADMTSTLQQTAMTSFGTDALPDAAYAEFPMTTAGINIILASTGSSFGQYSTPLSIILFQAPAPPATGFPSAIINNPIKIH
jgi:hypothetical protein